jgi:hypothetical protein
MYERIRQLFWYLNLYSGATIYQFNLYVVRIPQLRSLRHISLEGERLGGRRLSKDMVHRIGYCARLLLFANLEHIGGILLTGSLCPSRC